MFEQTGQMSYNSKKNRIFAKTNKDCNMNINIEERVLKAQELFASGYSCSQAVAVAYSDVCGVDEAFMAQISMPFGGGIARMHEVCGCVCSMALLSAFMVPAPNPQDITQVQKNRMLTKSMAERFRQEYGDIVCRNLLQNRGKHSCADFVAFAARVVGEAMSSEQ